MVMYNVIEQVTKKKSIVIAKFKTKEQAFDFIANEINQLLLEHNLFSGSIINKYSVKESFEK